MTTTTALLIAVLVLAAAAAGLWFGLRAGQRMGRHTGEVELARALEQRDAADARFRELHQDREDLFSHRDQQVELSAGLTRLGEQVQALQQSGIEWQSGLRTQLEQHRLSEEGLRREAAALADALRKPQTRGQWGELHLRRTVELAGLTDHCDFTEQVRLNNGTLRPDLVVHLPGDKHIAVDSKAPLMAFLDARETSSDTDRDAMLARHAKLLRSHADQLSSKQYWHVLGNAPEFVVMFLPGEPILAAALEADPELLEYAAGRQVLLCTPVSLIATLRAAAFGWQQASLATSSREVFEAGRDLHERLSTMGKHLDKLGRSISSTTNAYNAYVGSFEGRVLPSARRLSGLAGTELAESPPVTDQPRPFTAPELLGSMLPERAELDFGHEGVDDHRDPRDHRATAS